MSKTRAVCPNNPEHRHFITVAHVSQDWLVDEEGNFCEAREDLEVVAKPDFGNVWTCAECGAEAKIESFQLEEVPS